MNCNTNDILELKDQLDEQLRYAKAMLSVALIGDFMALDSSTQHDFLCVLDEKVSGALETNQALQNMHCTKQ